MNIKTLIAALSDKTILRKWEIKELIDSIFEIILSELEKGEEVHIKNFGKFTLKHHKERQTIHPKTKKPVEVPEKVSVVFKATRMFKPTQETIDRLANRAEK